MNLCIFTIQSLSRPNYDIHIQYSVTLWSSKTIHIQYSIHIRQAVFSIQFSIHQTKIQGIQYAIQYAVLRSAEYTVCNAVCSE